MLCKKYTRLNEMYSKRRLITKVDRSKLRRSVPIMDYNVMAKGKKKLRRKRKADAKMNITTNMKRRKFEDSNIRKIKKMVLLESGKNVSNTVSASTSTRPERTKITKYVEPRCKQFIPKQKYKNYIKINKKCPLTCSESLPDNSSVHTRSMTRQHNFIGSIYNKVLYNEELKINGQDICRDSTELPLWPEGEKTVSNVMLESLNHVLQFCSTYQKHDSDRKDIVMPVQSQNKTDINYFASERKYKQLHKLKVSDQRNTSEWKIDENGLEYKMIKISLPSNCDKLSSDDDVFVKPQDPSYYKALNKDYIKTVKRSREKEEINIPNVLISPRVDVLTKGDSEVKGSDSTIIIIDDEDGDDDYDYKRTELNDSDVSKSLYNMILNTSQLYCMLCGVPVTETTNYINNFRPVPF